MKKFSFAVSLLSVIVINSCTTYYYVQTDVDRGLNVTRRVHSAGSAGTDPVFPFDVTDGWNVSKTAPGLEVDFYDVKEKMAFTAEKAGAIGEVAVGNGGSDNPILDASETLGKRFRWFYTYYDYRAGFAGLKDRLPLPFEGYLTPEQMELFFRGGDPPGDWNGVEMYCLLDDVNQNFAKWYSDATYFVMCDIFEPFCTQEQVAVLDTAKVKFMEGAEREVMFAMTPAEFEDRLAEKVPEAGFGHIYEDNSEAIDHAYGQASRIIGYFETALVYSVALPGKYVDGNAESFTFGNPSWKVDAYRLMYGDLVLEATARKANIWAFILTFALIALLLQAFAKFFP